MSRDNVEVVRRGFEAINRGDPEGVVREMHPDIEWYPTDDFAEAGPFRGHAGVRQLMELMLGTFDSFSIEPDELIDGGGKVIAPIHQTGRGKSSGIEIDVRYVLVFTMRSGKAIRVDSYYDRDQALAAAGLSDQRP